MERTSRVWREEAWIFCGLFFVGYDDLFFEAGYSEEGDCKCSRIRKAVMWFPFPRRGIGNQVVWCLYACVHDGVCCIDDCWEEVGFNRVTKLKSINIHMTNLGARLGVDLAGKNNLKADELWNKSDDDGLVGMKSQESLAMPQ